MLEAVLALDADVVDLHHGREPRGRRGRSTDVVAPDAHAQHQREGVLAENPPSTNRDVGLRPRRVPLAAHAQLDRARHAPDPERQEMRREWPAHPASAEPLAVAGIVFAYRLAEVEERVQLVS